MTPITTTATMTTTITTGMDHPSFLFMRFVCKESYHNFFCKMTVAEIIIIEAMSDAVAAAAAATIMSMNIKTSPFCMDWQYDSFLCSMLLVYKLVVDNLSAKCF